MPLTGSTRMLRARRKDINVKPNRRLDRKSSKGMLFENEELRMRTIAINAEVEQGQHALKKLRRENELLRREVWSLRDENSKMERMLHKKGSDEEDTDQEEYSDEEDSEDLEDEEDEGELEDLPEIEEETETQEQTTTDNPDVENEENLQKSSLFAPRRGSRLFDGLSVIDEQTEETTQTTDGHPNSRGSSVVRLPSVAADANGFRSMGEPFAYADPKVLKTQRKLGGFSSNGFDSDWDIYGGLRPSSPYPYTKAAPIPSYEHRLQNIQEPTIPPLPASDDPGWLPDQGQVPFTGPLVRQVAGAPGYPPLSIVQERLGPDVFIADACTYLPSRSGHVDLIGVQSDLNKIEISQKAESSPKYTIPNADDSAISPVSATQSANHVETTNNSQAALVSCQSPVGEDSRQIALTEAEGEDHVPADGMPKPPGDRQGAKSFQSKLSVTLKFPENGRKSPGRQVSGSAVGPAKPARLATPHKHELPRLQTFQTAAARSTATTTVRVPTPPNVATPSLERSGTTAGTLIATVGRPVDIPIHQTVPSAAANFPKTHGSTSSLESAAKATVNDGATGLAKGQKTPPAPPPRTSSCPTPTGFPSLTIGVTALHQRAFRKGKSTSSSQLDSDRELQNTEAAPSGSLLQNTTNPLLMNEPIATSSPTMRPKFSNSEKSSTSQRSPKLRKQSSVRSMNMEDTTDEGGGILSSIGMVTGRRSKTQKTEPERLSARKLRKQSQVSISSLDNNLLDRRASRILGLNNISISSSSGIDSPTKTDRRTRRVSIKFNKRTPSGEPLDEERPGILTNLRSKSRCEEYDGTYSERERTNSVSSRASSMTRRKLSTSSSRTVFHEEKIPWCGCWGNGCV